MKLKFVSMSYILYEEEVEIADVQGDVKCSPDLHWLWLLVHVL